MAATDYMTFAEFRETYTEFRSAPDPVVARALEDAQEYIHLCTFGGLARAAHGYKVAHMLAVSPFGRPLKLQRANGSTHYGDEFDSIIQTVSPKAAVL